MTEQLFGVVQVTWTAVRNGAETSLLSVRLSVF